MGLPDEGEGATIPGHIQVRHQPSPINALHASSDFPRSLAIEDIQSHRVIMDIHKQTPGYVEEKFADTRPLCDPVSSSTLQHASLLTFTDGLCIFMCHPNSYSL